MALLNYATGDFAAEAMRRWDGDTGSLLHIGDSGNSVYRFTQGGVPRILRLTDTSYRTKAQNLAEADFLRHADAHGVPVGAPVPSSAGALVEDIVIGGTCWMASVFSYAPGVVMSPESPDWAEPFFREWGRALGRLHRASARYVPSVDGRRWHWHEEDLAANARRYIPPDDAVSLREFDALWQTFHALPKTPQNYGMTHADLGPQNFHYHPQHGVTMFDFGNCCYHWYAADLVIAFMTLRRYPDDDRARYEAWMLAGYEAEYALDPAIWAHRDDFRRWRIVYIYLDRLERFGASPSPEHVQILADLRQRVHRMAGVK